MLVDAMGVTATYKGKKIVPVGTADKFDDIKNGIVGTYDILVSGVEGGGASETAKLTIVSDDTIITPDKKGYVYAENKQITSTEAKALANKAALVQ